MLRSRCSRGTRAVRSIRDTKTTKQMCETQRPRVQSAHLSVADGFSCVSNYSRHSCAGRILSEGSGFRERSPRGTQSKILSIVGSDPSSVDRFPHPQLHQHPFENVHSTLTPSARRSAGSELSAFRWVVSTARKVFPWAGVCTAIVKITESRSPIYSAIPTSSPCTEFGRSQPLSILRNTSKARV